MKALILGLAALAAGPATAAQIILTPANIVGTTTSFGINSGFGGDNALVNSQFGSGNIFDSQLAPPQETEQQGYWLAGDGRFTPTPSQPASITIDLGAIYVLTGFTLFNTSNADFGDRGTGDFTIYAGNALSDNDPYGQTLDADAVVLVQGTLAAHVPLTAPIAQSFGAAGGGYRYLQFVPTSVAANDPATPIAYGLNELRVFGDQEGVSAVPEPASWAMLIAGFGMVGATLRRPARRAVVA